jgi:hypothetical protein
MNEEAKLAGSVENDPLRSSGPISAVQQRLTALTLGNAAKVFQPRGTVGRIARTKRRRHITLSRRAARFSTRLTCDGHHKTVDAAS